MTTFLRLLDRVTDSLRHGDVLILGRYRLSVALAIVVAMAATINGIQLIGAPFLYFPDSGGYVLSAFQIFFEGRFDGIGLSRTVGYPAFLAPIMGLAGKHAVIVMAGLQHAMAVAIAFLAFKIVEELHPSRLFAFIAGLLTAFSLQLQSYARLPMSEVLYTFVCMIALLCALRYAKSGATRAFLMAVFLFSVAALVRAGGKLLPFMIIAVPLMQALFPNWRFLFPSREIVGKPDHIKRIGFGIVIVAVVYGPWSFYNLIQHGYFGLNGTLGLNLFSNTVEYGKFADEKSAALADIRKRWDEFEAIRAAKGESPETKYTWRNHWLSFGHYMGATGLSMHEADKVYLRAAKDAIAAHPLAFVTQILDNIYISAALPEVTYLYNAAVPIGTKPPWYMPYAWSMEYMTASTDRLISVIDGYFPKLPNPIHYRPPNAFSPVYGTVSSIYHRAVANANLTIAVFLASLAAMIGLMVRQNDVRWLVVLGYLANTVILAMVVVPGSPRHRIPADPIINIGTAAAILVLLSALAWGWSVLRRYGYGVADVGGDAAAPRPMIKEARLFKFPRDRKQVQAWALIALAAYLAVMAVVAKSKAFGLAFVIALAILFL